MLVITSVLQYQTQMNDTVHLLLWLFVFGAEAAGDSSFRLLPEQMFDFWADFIHWCRRSAERQSAAPLFNRLFKLDLIWFKRRISSFWFQFLWWADWSLWTEYLEVGVGLGWMFIEMLTESNAQSFLPFSSCKALFLSHAAALNVTFQTSVWTCRCFKFTLVFVGVRNLQSEP